MLSIEEKATNAETQEHIYRVRKYMNLMIHDLIERAQNHDRTKLDNPEVELFAKYTPMLAKTTYNSDEYRQTLADLKPALDHHYARNRHHPEHFPLNITRETKDLENDISELEEMKSNNNDLSNNQKDLIQRSIDRLKNVLECQKSRINGMNILDILEMLCDWKAACERQINGNIRQSIDINATKFAINDQVKNFMENTIEILDK